MIARLMVIKTEIIGRSENESMMPFKNEVRPGVVHTLQGFSFAEVKMFVLIKQGRQIWLPYRLKEEELAINRKNLRWSSALRSNLVFK